MATTEYWPSEIGRATVRKEWDFPIKVETEYDIYHQQTKILVYCTTSTRHVRRMITVDADYPFEELQELITSMGLRVQREIEGK